MHYSRPDPVVHPYPHASQRDQHHASAQERAEVSRIHVSNESSRQHVYDPDDDYEAEMGLVGALN